MNVASLLLELYGRIPPVARRAVDGVDLERLTVQPSPGTNPISWLIWHIARVQDHHVAALLDENQLWVDGDWAHRFGLEPNPANTGYGHTPVEVASVQPDSPGLLLAYLDAVDERTRGMLQDLTAADLDGIVDRRWDPPVTMGVRLVSIAADGLQHAGQAAYVRGLLGM
ncbi:MAG TPA: DinB family protein [Jiangellaceae bacterium]|nr:DinB family protein [Jiangellaceae bacterium]